MNEFKEFLSTHQNDYHLSIDKIWWIKYLYHFSNIDNIVNILTEGFLFSRNECVTRGNMINENASTEIIHQTNTEISDYVRLYFRPKTPTQYHNEGFSILQERKYASVNIPVPIFLAFRSYEVLNLPNVSFSDTSLATHNYQLFHAIEDFRQLDFKAIYHEGILKDEEKIYITQKRQAEVIIKEKLDLSFLDMIWCRSNAEYVTLINLLQEKNVLEKYRNKISVKQASDLFYMHHTYIDIVNLVDNAITIHLKNVADNDAIKMIINLKIGNIEYPKEVVIKPKRNYRYDLTNYLESIFQEGKYSVKIYFVDLTAKDEKPYFIYYGKWSVDFDLPY